MTGGSRETVFVELFAKRKNEIEPRSIVFSPHAKQLDETMSEPQSIAYGTPEMDELLAEADRSIAQTEQYFAEAGVTMEEVEEFIAIMPKELRSEYDRLLAEDQADSATAWKAKRKELLQKYRSASETSEASVKKPRRVRVDL